VSWDNILKVYYQKQEIDDVVQEYSQINYIDILVNDIIDNTVYINISDKKHLKNLKNHLIQKVPWITYVNDISENVSNFIKEK
jgi:hypothetical protein